MVVICYSSTKKTILKVGLRVHMGESEAMILARNQTSVPVPKVFNAYMIEEIGFILMEKIDGMQLGRNWSKLPRGVKESLAQELRGYIQQWRQIKGSFFGTVDNGPCQEIIFQHPWENKVYRYGPFATRRGFNKGMVEALAKSRPNLRLETEQDIRFAEELLMSGTDQEEIKVFTHGDLDMSNIMIQDGEITAIIDWGAAGYSVPEREYFALRWRALDKDWCELSTSILPPDGYEYWYNINRQMKLYTCI
jgi:aminoglycoside phosphotransferase (APT) family kinase protein